eukprot:364228-Chlamydomonas_euryale.AAC.5
MYRSCTQDAPGGCARLNIQVRKPSTDKGLAAPFHRQPAAPSGRLLPPLQASAPSWASCLKGRVAFQCITRAAAVRPDVDAAQCALCRGSGFAAPVGMLKGECYPLNIATERSPVPNATTDTCYSFVRGWGGGRLVLAMCFRHKDRPLRTEVAGGAERRSFQGESELQEAGSFRGTFHKLAYELLCLERQPGCRSWRARRLTKETAGSETSSASCN